MAPTGVVIERIDGTGSPVLVRVRPAEGPLEFSAGQHVHLTLKGGESGYYSICSSTEERSYFEICIGVAADPAGAGFRALEPGDVVTITGMPSGALTFDDLPIGAHALMIASGTGASPFVSVLRSPVRRRAARLTLVHGVRAAADLVFERELSDIVSANRALRYVPVLSRPEPSWRGDVGRVQDVIEREISLLGRENLEVFLCGRSEMVSDLTAYFQARGLAGRLHVEAY